MRRAVVIVFWLALASVPAARAQSAADEGPQKGDSEIQIWSAGGHSGINGAKNTGAWTAGLRYGWILTNAHGRGLLRGRLEYAVDAVPVYLFFQPRGVVYGAGVNPFAFKWNLVRRGGVAPYVDLGAGVVFTSSAVPAGVSHVNFASGTALGANFGHGRAHWSLEARWLHVSDANITNVNPGVNLIMVRAGLGWFRHNE